MDLSELKTEIGEIKNLADGRIKDLEQDVKDLQRENESLKERVEIRESLDDRPSASIGGKYSALDNEHKSVFLDFVRNPSSASARSLLEEADREISSKAVNIGTNARGGFALPAEIANEVELRVTTLNPFRQIVRVVQAGSSDYAHLVSKNNPSNSWVAEDGSRTESTTSDLVQRKPTFGTCYSLPKVSEEALADIFFDVQAWLVREVSDNFAAAEAEAIVTGNGTARPTGFLNTTPVSTVAGASPEAAAGGPIAIVQDGDTIAIDLDARSITLELSDDEIHARQSALEPHQPNIQSRWLRRYAKLVSSASTGAVFLD